MIDKNIEYKSIIMRCDKVNSLAFCELSKDVEIHYYTYGMDDVWVEIQKSTGAFEAYSDADIKKYFKDKFLCNPNELMKRCIFLKDLNTGVYVGTCCAWIGKKENEDIPILHWLAVREEFQNRGYAKMLMTEIMKIFMALDNGKAIYLHTQPSSYKAIKLYSDLGFCISKHDTYGSAKNEYEEALKILKKYMKPKVLKTIQESLID